MKNINEKYLSEQTTGCVQQGKIVYYQEGGKKVTPKQAAELLQNNELVEVPSAGAGNFREIFEDLGFDKVEVIDWTSSAGDWTFGVKNDDGWVVATQENRYPYHGFRYNISDLFLPCETFEQLCEEIEYLMEF